MELFKLRTEFERSFNAGIVKYDDGKYLSVFRVNDNDIRLAWLDNNFNVIKTYRPDVSGITDPKLIRIGDKHKLIYSYSGYGNHLEYMEIADISIDNNDDVKYLNSTKLRQLTIFDYPGYVKGREKSWAPFSYANRLYFVYKKSPHIVIEFDNEINNVKYNKNYEHKFDEIAKFGDIYGDGNAIQFNDELLISTFHTKSNPRTYYVGYYFFESSPPFRPAKICNSYLFNSKQHTISNRGPLIKANESCVFPSSFVDYNKENLVLSVGVNDYENHFLLLNKKCLLENSTTIASVGLSGYIEKIRNSSIDNLNNQKYLENLIADSGIANGVPRIGGYANKYNCGLNIAQIPSQLAKYLMFIKSRDINSYMEIGVLNGGCFIFTTEFLNKFHKIERSIAIDINDCDMINRYKKEYNNNVEFYRFDTNGEQFAKFCDAIRIDLCMIDGDHSWRGVNNDFMNASKCSRYVAMHDILDSPDVSKYYKTILRRRDEFVDHNVLGIGLFCFE